MVSLRTLLHWEEMLGPQQTTVLLSRLGLFHGEAEAGMQ